MIGWLIGVTAILAVICAELGAQLAGQFQRAPWCWCGHLRTVHHHDGTGPDWHCSLCACGRFGSPIVRRITA